MQIIREHFWSKTKQLVLTMSFIYIPIWSVFFLNFIIPDQVLYPLLGIHPRNIDLFTPFSFIGSWLVHVNYNHILNNSISIFWLTFFIGLFEKNSFKLLFILIATSGFSTWLIGSSHSVHIGASGLIFAMFGYIISATFLGKKWIYLIPIIISFIYYGFIYFSSFIKGMIPQDGISFAGHFGGFISGLIVGAFYEIKRKRNLDKSQRSL